MATHPSAPLTRVEIPGIECLHRGKVRDLFGLQDHLLIVATDRVSAFDVVLDDALPEKGEVLNRISEFWFRHFEKDVRHHLLTTRVEEMPAPLPEHPELRGRSMLCKRVQPLQAEFVVRGYLAGSGFKDYKRSGKVCGIELPAGLVEGDALPQPLFTPSTKAEQGLHDENISFDQLCEILGPKRAEEGRDLVLNLYRQAHAYAHERGIILADTKIEIGEDEEGLLVIDELFTPDSSRFWPLDRYRPGQSQPSYDKQIIRNALEGTDWNKQPPAPRISETILQEAAAAYREIFEKLTETPFR
jgi:phosphoribosylaminoimidazole-succinocarboxamide synthase